MGATQSGVQNPPQGAESSYILDLNLTVNKYFSILPITKKFNFYL